MTRKIKAHDRFFQLMIHFTSAMTSFMGFSMGYIGLKFKLGWGFG